MQAKKRYLLVLLSCAFLAYCYFGGYRLKSERKFSMDDLPSFMDSMGYEFKTDDVHHSSSNIQTSDFSGDNFQRCRMETCFDYEKCHSDFKVYVYPSGEETGEDGEINPEIPMPPQSAAYQRLLSVITESRYYTSNPEEACLFVLSLDTLDRDSLSPDYVRNMPARLQRLRYWNNGRNHVIFNLYAGTWPDYLEDGLGFNPGMAILAKASMSVSTLRPGFDVSIPLFHKNHPQKGGDPGSATTNNFPANKRYLLAFKGKRYVHGIGSETRNALFHLHNEEDIILVTTCRHGKSWKEMKDERCDEDNAQYDRFDYETLLQNATFCLVPRGRRLGSFRFLEALQAGCVPVLLSNSWALPFEEVLDWSLAAVWADERLLLQVPDLVRSIPEHRILALRQQTQILWERYFSSIEKVVFTTLEIIRERLLSQPKRDNLSWNRAPGALVWLPSFADSPRFYPFLNDLLSYRADERFTAVVYAGQLAVSGSAGAGGSASAANAPSMPTPALTRLIRNVARSKYVRRLVVLWCSDRPVPPTNRWPVLRPEIIFFIQKVQPHHGTGKGNGGISQRFYPYDWIDTDAVLSLDEDALLTTDEIDFAFNVWLSFTDRIVGYPARSHYWDDAKGSWGYTSKWTNDYSIVLTGAAFYHRYYNYLYWHWLSPLLHKTVEQSQNCEDILMNFLVSHVTRRPPIKVTQRKQYKEQPPGGARSPWNDPDHFIQRQTCLNTFAAVFGYMPLLRSNMRLDPVLFKDPVSNLRKKYRQIERVGS